MTNETTIEEYREQLDAEAQMIQEQWEEVGEQFEQQDDTEKLADKFVARLVGKQWVEDPTEEAPNRWRNTETGEYRYQETKPGSSEGRGEESESDDSEAVDDGDGGLPDTGWVGYVNEQGEQGWRDMETGEVVFDDEPPGEVNTEPLEEQPMQEGHNVVLEYDGETHYGEVLQVDEDGERARVRDDRNLWTLDADQTEQYDGDMVVENIGAPISDQQDPETMDITSPDDLSYVMSEQDTPEEAVEYLYDSLGDMSKDEIMEAVEDTGYSERFVGSELMRMHANSEVDGHTVSADADRDGAMGLRNELKEQDTEAAETMYDAARGWEGSMYAADNAAPMIQLAMEETGNEQLPEYDANDRAAAADIDDETIDEMDRSTEFTTEKLREAYGDEITVFRGMSENPHGGTRSEGTDVVEKLQDAKESGESVEVEHRPLESWSLEPTTAKLYASSGAVIKTTVPVEEVMASSSVGTIDPSENDTVVQHEGPQMYSPDEIYAGDELNDDETLFELRLDAVKGMTGNSEKADDSADIVISAEENQAGWIRAVGDTDEDDDEEDVAAKAVERLRDVLE